MRANSNNSDLSLYITVKNAMSLISASRKTTMFLADNANAIIKNGRFIRINKDKLLAYLENNYGT